MPRKASRSGIVICLKNRTFAVSQTSNFRRCQTRELLWFAWKIVLLQYHKHPVTSLRSSLRSCDLLEKSYFCSITNIWLRVFWASAPGCDLLEKSYFCSITNIIVLKTLIFVLVVICLKNRTFAVSQTSVRVCWPRSSALWFAWKIVLLQYHKHQVGDVSLLGAGCDLLEKSYFCSITNISSSSTPFAGAVVICLKNRTFAVSQTSVPPTIPAASSLWFAWKIVLLQYHKHQRHYAVDWLYCCDLLEKSYFCSITNITSSCELLPQPVVICLKNRTFAVSQTSLR